MEQKADLNDFEHGMVVGATTDDLPQSLLLAKNRKPRLQFT